MDPDRASTINTLTKNENGTITVDFDLAAENFPCLQHEAWTGTKGEDWSSYSSISIVVRNPNAQAMQIQGIVKAGPDWTWVELKDSEASSYTIIPAKETMQIIISLNSLTAPQKSCIDRFMIRMMTGNSAFAGKLDFLSIEFDKSSGAYNQQISEINRPKSISYFTWSYPESDWTANTTSTKLENGKLTVGYGAITSTKAAGPQTETKPGLGTGMDMSSYSTLSCTVKNTGTTDVHMTLVFKTTGDWTWQENAGLIEGTSNNNATGGEMIIPAGESVNIVYSLTGSEWKSAASNWNFNGSLSGLSDVRAIAFKIYAGSGTATPGTLEFTDFSLDF